MNKDKVVKLKAYLEQLGNRLDAKTPSKHTGHPDTYKQFLTREIKTVKDQLEAARLEGTGK